MDATPKAVTEEGNVTIKATTTAAIVVRDSLAKIVKVFALLIPFCFDRVSDNPPMTDMKCWSFQAISLYFAFL